ncbi:MAG: malto-oligosyltrehalose synthase [Candidatus Kapaibacterium sp.]
MQAYNPVSTYRFQFNRDFTFSDAGRLISYLEKTGAGTIYASPIAKAVSGSTHGYDLTDPLELNPEIGTEEEFIRLADERKRKGIGWLQDIVPNHMAYSHENILLMDVLEKWKLSSFFNYFDILTEENEKLLLPFLGKNTDEAIESGELKIAFTSNGFVLKYYESEYPLSIPAYKYFKEIYPGPLPYPLNKMAEFRGGSAEWNDLNNEMINTYGYRDEIIHSINYLVKNINEQPENILKILDKLYYAPVFWRVTEKKINYRRFFSINGLICVRQEDEGVFRDYHGMIFGHCNKGLIDGLRIDHIDGLFNPARYLESLREFAGKDKYIIVEKILEKDENPDSNWPVQGTTGYDFLALVNNLLTNNQSKKEFREYYERWSEEGTTAREEFYRKKEFFLMNRLAGELDNLVRLFMELAPAKVKGFSRNSAEKAIAEFLIHFPVYRVYYDPGTMSEESKKFISSVIEKVKAEEGNEEIQEELEFLNDIFTSKKEIAAEDPDAVNFFFRRLMQLSGPLMAKGLEDTAFYSYNLFIAHNEVGDSPGYFGITNEEFHDAMLKRQQESPLTMNATATHDTKRGEDSRARLNALSDYPERWGEMAEQWHKMNQSLKVMHKGKEAPDRNDEYFIYQALAGAFPMDIEPDESFRSRFNDYLIKVLREAKFNTNWSDPDEEYERISLGFVDSILHRDSVFFVNFRHFMREVIDHGIINSLTQLLLKNTCPGVPDTYRGCESWDLSFVDPDNRRPVDYERLGQNLDHIIENYGRSPDKLYKELWKTRHDGRIKQLLTFVTLNERKAEVELFAKGKYIPLNIQGKFADNIIAFIRKYKKQHYITAVILNTAAIGYFDDDFDWEDTRIELIDFTPPEWQNIITGNIITSEKSIKAKDILKDTPVAFLKGRPAMPKREAGLLLHVSSLPGEFGIGGFGREAYEFIDLLEAAGQSIWQILPLNASDMLTGYSPYSSLSALAGNVILTDPRYLVEQGLIDEKAIATAEFPDSDKADYRGAEEFKHLLLDKACAEFKHRKDHPLHEEFKVFIEKEKHWLDDFALFITLKRFYKGAEWNTWPMEYRDRHEAALEQFREKFSFELEKVRFKQFIFTKQWSAVKEYANDRGIKIFGDVPIYVSYDSADVWARPEMFRLDAEKKPVTVAGVPPDYFSKTGQLWNMPIYRWDFLKENGYDWWIKRLVKNLEWYDLVRLDHFRGFSAYWEVPAREETAINGKWVEGPGQSLFDTLKNEFPEMPFVAEDLGKIDRPVYDLRDNYGLPGMKVLQFAFGDNTPFQPHITHNHGYNSIAYTGTHDNNTARGWFRKEADSAMKKKIEQYTGIKVKEKNCHEVILRICFSSPAKIAIAPVQDILGLDEKSRMNTPSTTKGNWLWKLRQGQLNVSSIAYLKEITEIFGRY